jgi:hypothetical protein
MSLSIWAIMVGLWLPVLAMILWDVCIDREPNKPVRSSAAAVQGLTGECSVHDAKPEAERRKNRRENLTIGSLIATTAITLALAIIGVLQWLTLDKSDETNRVGLRPYISGVGLTADVERFPLYWNLSAILENSGGTPPFELRYVLRSSPELPLDPEEVFQHPSETDAFFERSVAPKGQIQVAAGMPLVSFFEGRKAWYISGAIHYRDQFRGTPDHVSKFCFAVVSVKDIKTGSMRPGYDPCVFWNCIDEKACANDRARYDQAVRNGVIRPVKKSSDTPNIPIGTAIPSPNGMVIKALP